MFLDKLLNQYLSKPETIKVFYFQFGENLHMYSLQFEAFGDRNCIEYLVKSLI